MKPQTRFLLSGLASAASTANALRPAARTGRVSIPSFADGAPALRAPAADLRDVRGRPRRTPRPRRRHPRVAGQGRARRARRVDRRPRRHRPRARQAAASSSRRWSRRWAPTTAAGSSEPFSPAPEVPLTRQQLLARTCRCGRSTCRPATCRTATPGCATSSTSGSGPTCPPTPRRPCSSRCTAAPGWWA